MVEMTKNNLEKRIATVERTLTPELQGRVSGMTGLTVEVDDFAAPTGAQCEIITRNHNRIRAEVIGFRNRGTVLMPLGQMVGIASGDRVRCLSAHPSVSIGPELLGRIIDGRGEPIDGKGPLLCQTSSSSIPGDRRRIPVS